MRFYAIVVCIYDLSVCGEVEGFGMSRSRIVAVLSVGTSRIIEIVWWTLFFDVERAGYV